MSDPEPLARWLKAQIDAHLRVCFRREARDVFARADLRLLPWAEAQRVRARAMVIPTDLTAPLRPEAPWRTPFADTELTLWNRLPVPDGAWRAHPSVGCPLWYAHESGTLVPAWNLFANVTDLLCFREEREIRTRDRHGRFPSAASPRHAAGLLGVPAFNEAVAALVGAARGMLRDGVPEASVDGLVAPPGLALSHDGDILAGGDPFTQASRIAQSVAPLARARAPRLSKLWFVLRNAAAPRSFYFDNLTGMSDAEREFGFRSAFYLLNGRRGRFCARSAPRWVARAARAIPSAWAVGIHYNHDTFLDDERFAAQERALRALAPRFGPWGRAHYLRLDPERSFEFLSRRGIRLDESAGYSDRTGYRAGIAGVFRPFDAAAGRAHEIWELPLVCMDMNQTDGGAGFESMLRHVSRIGGILSLLFHPGRFENPEYPETRGVYLRMLAAAHALGARSWTPPELLETLETEESRGGATGPSSSPASPPSARASG